MSREREIRKALEHYANTPPYDETIVVARYFEDIPFLLSIIDEQRKDAEDRSKHYSEGAGDCWLKTKQLKEENERLSSIIDEQRAETERLRSQVRRWKQKYEMADTEW